MNFEDSPSDTEKEIRLYLLDQLPPPQMQAVASRIAADAAYAQAVDEMRWMLSLAQVARHDRMQAQVRAAGKRARTPPGIRRSFYLGAAAVALLAAFGTYFWTRPSLGKRIAARYDERHHSHKATMGGAANQAFRLYDEAVAANNPTGFDAAIQALGAIPATDLEYDDAQYYLAQSYLGKQDPQSAIPILEAYRSRTSELNFLYHEATWYLALALLYEDRLAEAKALLVPLSKRVVDEHSRDAQDILEQLP